MNRRAGSIGALFLKKFKKVDRKKRLHPMRGIILFFFILIIVAGGGCWFWWQGSLKPAGEQNQDPQSFIIPRGESVDSVLRRLKTDGLIRSPLAAKIYLRINRLETKIQAGDYRLFSGWELEKILTALQYGQKQVVITMPEGYRLEQVAGLLCKTGVVCEQGYEGVLTKLRQDIGEGYFFPDTYYLDEAITLDAFILKVKDNYNQKTRPLFDLPLPPAIISTDQINTAASLIEREALTDIERPLIAGVIMNRLNNQWPLQIDATIQYILGCSTQSEKQVDCQNSDWWPNNIQAKDLKIKSSFNTYLNTGLPPKPICNPGFASIQAVLEPATSDYFFYLHDSEGVVHFAKTQAEHNQNIIQYLNGS